VGRVPRSPTAGDWTYQLFQEAGLTLGGHQVHPEMTHVKAMTHEACCNPADQHRLVVVHRAGPGFATPDQTQTFELSDRVLVKAHHDSQLGQGNAHRSR